MRAQKRRLESPPGMKTKTSMYTVFFTCRAVEGGPTTYPEKATRECSFNVDRVAWYLYSYGNVRSAQPEGRVLVTAKAGRRKGCTHCQPAPGVLAVSTGTPPSSQREVPTSTQEGFR